MRLNRDRNLLMNKRACLHMRQFFLFLFFEAHVIFVPDLKSNPGPVTSTYCSNASKT